MNIIVLGKLGKPFGLEGWQFFPHYMEDPHSLLQYDALFFQPLGAPWRKAEGKPVIKNHKNRVLIKMPAVDSREKTLDYLHGLLGVQREQLPQPEEGSYYWSDLIGMSVINSTSPSSESALGEVFSLQRCGSQDVMQIERISSAGKKQYVYVPFVLPAPVKRVDLHNRQIYISWDLDY